MSVRRTSTGGVVAAGLVLLAASACAPESPPAVTAAGGLDGTEQSIVLSGDPGAPGWPMALQELLDLHARGRIYHVLDGAVAGAPLGAWIAPAASPDYQRTVGSLTRLVRPDSAGRHGAPIPKTILWLPPRPPAGESAPDTFETLEVLALRLRDFGFERVLLARPPGPEGEPYDRLGRLGHAFVVIGPELPALPAGENLAGEAAQLLAQRAYRTLVGAAAHDELAASSAVEEAILPVE